MIKFKSAFNPKTSTNSSLDKKIKNGRFQNNTDLYHENDDDQNKDNEKSNVNNKKPLMIFISGFDKNENIVLGDIKGKFEFIEIKFQYKNINDIISDLNVNLNLNCHN